jgi:regulator of sigma E protease
MDPLFGLVGLLAVAGAWLLASSVRAVVRYTVAIKTGLKVHRFALGLGPVLVPKLFTLRGSPVQLRLVVPFLRVEVNGLATPDQDDMAPGSLRARATTVVAGLLSTLVVAWVAFFIATMGTGTVAVTNRVQVQPNGPAAVAGIIDGDAILQIDGRSVVDAEAVRQALAAVAQPPVEVVVLRGADRKRLMVEPREGQRVRWEIGVNFEAQRHPIGVVPAAQTALAAPFNLLTSAAHALDRQHSMAGPVGSTFGAPAGPGFMFARLVGNIATVLTATAVLPLPGLDGARLLLLALEAVRKRRTPAHIERIASNGGIGCLAWGVMIFIVIFVFTILR